MKRLLPLALILSLAGNGLLLAKWLRPASAAVPSTASPANAAVDDRAGQAEAPATDKAAGVRLWAALGRPEPKAFLARLTEAGFPPAVARSLVRWQILESFRPRRDAIVAADPADPLRSSVFSREASRQLTAITFEQSEALLAALGPDMGLQEDRTSYNRHYYGFLPSEKAVKVATLAAEYDALRSQIYAETSGGFSMAQNRDKLALIEKEFRRDLAATLTPAELELYDLNRSNTATRLRVMLDLFAPTEAEFRAVFAAQQEFDQKYSNVSFASMDPSQREQRNKDQQALQQKIGQSLGEERYKEYQRGQDISYRVASQIVDHFNLPKENAVAVHALRTEFEQHRMKIMGDGTAYPTVESKNEAQQAALRETTAKLDALLTPAGAAAFMESGGYWLRSTVTVRR